MSDDALTRWQADLAAWAIPQRIIDQAPASPWTPEHAVFVRRAAARRAAPRGRSYARARAALPSGGSVLDVGAGAGAASLPLLDRAAALYAVDQDEQLLARIDDQAGVDRAKVTRVIGSWPSVAAAVPVVDVVVCHHVLYNVPDLRPFIEALDAHARRRVVIEITARHPLARLNPLWRRFHSIERPERPTAEDALRAIRSIRPAAAVEREEVAPDPPAGTWEELVGATTRRLCLGPDRSSEVAAALTEAGAQPDAPATWSNQSRDIVTFWWDPSPR